MCFRGIGYTYGANRTGNAEVTLDALGSRPRALMESPVLPGLKSSSAFTVLPNRFGMLRAPSMALSPPPQAVRIREVESSDANFSLMPGSVHVKCIWKA